MAMLSASQKLQALWNPPEGGYPDPTIPWARNRIPLKENRIDLEHAGNMLSAESPGTTITLEQKEEQVRNIKADRKLLIQDARTFCGSVIGVIANHLELKNSDGVIVSTHDETIQAFGQKVHPSYTTDDLIDIQANLLHLQKGERLDILFQRKYMGRRSFYYLGQNGEHGTLDKGACISNMYNHVKGDLMDKIRDSSLKYRGWKVVGRKPPKDVALKYDIEKLDSRGWVLSKKDHVGKPSGAAAAATTTMKSLEDQIALLQEQQKQLLLEMQRQQLPHDEGVMNMEEMNKMAAEVGIKITHTGT